MAKAEHVANLVHRDRKQVELAKALRLALQQPFLLLVEADQQRVPVLVHLRQLAPRAVEGVAPGLAALLRSVKPN